MKAKATRTAILDAAVELGSLRGLEELSLGGLASMVEMSKSGLFAHFGSKEELQLATVAQAWDVFEAEVVRDPRADGSQPLSALVERWLSFYERRIFIGGCFFVTSAVQFASRRDAVCEALAGAVRGQTAALEAAVQRARESGELAPTGQDAGQTAFALFAILVNADAVFRLQDDPAVFERAREAIGELLHEPESARRAA